MEPSRPMKAPRASMSQIGARSPWRCGRNSGVGRWVALVAARAESSDGARPVRFDNQASDAPPDCVGPACMVMPSQVGKATTPAAGWRELDTRPTISEVPERYMQSPSWTAPVPISPAQASMAPVTKGSPANGKPGWMYPATSVKPRSGGSRSAKPSTSSTRRGT